MDTLIIQDTFEPYCSGKDQESRQAVAKPGKRWLALRGKEEVRTADPVPPADSSTGA
jgi:hypothetical protein